MQRLAFFATATRGTEPLVAEELAELGAAKVKQDRGGVRFVANLHEVARICLHARTVMRLLHPLGEFDAPGADGLYEAARQVPWEEWLGQRSTFAVEATLKDSEHTHSGFVALKVKDGLVDRLREKWGRRPDVDTQSPDVSIVAHLAKQRLTLSLDVSGEPLFKRGYRIQSTTAPMKETLAAVVLRAAKFDGEEPFCDPMCGSGTLAIEAGLIATRRPPGLKREVALAKWPQFAAFGPLWEEAKREAHAQVRSAPFALFARDWDAETLAAAKRNVTAAGLGAVVRLEESDATRDGPPPGPGGAVISNPPYGERLGSGGQKGMKTFFHSLGKAFDAWPGWRLALFVGNPSFESAFGRKPQGRVALWNGSIECRLLSYPPRSPANPPEL
jgi:23S rRNA (guanine2445-N2)-methyltransferase / 23S rRNA (guanine2069-N7)-methyltransferase